MATKHTITETIEDHALERVPEGERRGWLAISWGTVGIVTTLVQLYIGALVTFVAGFQTALAAGLAVAVMGAALGWGLGHIAYKTGLSSTMLARYYGFGLKGVPFASLIYATLIIGFLALENVLLYKGFLFFFRVPETTENAIVVYGILSIAWVLLTACGFEAVSRVSSLMLIGFLCVLGYIVYDVLASSGRSWGEVTAFATQFSADTLSAMGITGPIDKFVFCVNVMITSAGALAFVDADLGRYAVSSRAIGTAAIFGNAFMDIAMVAVGGIVMYAGIDQLVQHFVAVGGMTEDAARHMATESPDSVAAAFIVFGGIWGTLLMVLAQSKAQVLNTYSASLTLTNLFDAAAGWRPGRIAFVVMANLIALGMLYGEILAHFQTFITVLGVLVTCFCGIILADYFIVRPRLGHRDIAIYGMDRVNWAGIASLIAGFLLAHFVLNRVVTIEFFSSIGVSFVIYPLLRLTVLKPHYLPRI